MAKAWASYCTRCGEHPFIGNCVHPLSLAKVISREEAERIRARYALGKRYNPDHDTTSYRDGND